MKTQIILSLTNNFESFSHKKDVPAILLKAKDFAIEITIFNAKEKAMKNEHEVLAEYSTNNKVVGDALISRGITPENLFPVEDIKKVESKLLSPKSSTITLAHRVNQ